MYAPYGPHKVGQNRQVALPADLMKIVNLEPGDSVYLQANPDNPGTLLVIPVEMAAAWFDAGRRVEQGNAAAPSDDAARD